MLNIQKLLPNQELEIAPGYQRIYLTLEMRGLRKDPRSPADFRFKPYLSIYHYADMSFNSLKHLSRSGPSWPMFGESLSVSLPLAPSSVPISQVRMEVYQPLDRRENPNESTKLEHSIDLPAYLYKPILKKLLKFPPTQNPHERDWGAILSYDVPLDATPPSEKIPNFERGDFSTITRTYLNIDPIHLHVFDPPRYDTHPDDRKFREGPGSRAFLDYSMASYAFSVRPLGRVYGHLTNPFKSAWSYIRLKWAYYQLRKAMRKD